MSFVIDRVRAVDSLLGRLEVNHVSWLSKQSLRDAIFHLQSEDTAAVSSKKLHDLLRCICLSTVPYHPSTNTAQTGVRFAFLQKLGSGDFLCTPEKLDNATRVDLLQGLIKSLSTTSQAKPSLATIRQLLWILHQADVSSECAVCHGDGGTDSYEHELEWLLIGKVATHTYGHALDTLLRQYFPLTDSLWYWDAVLESRRNSTLYWVQTSPWRLWDLSTAAFHDFREHEGQSFGGWRYYYELVRTSVQKRSLPAARNRLVDPIVFVRMDVHKKQSYLERARKFNAIGVGILLSHGLGDEKSLKSSIEASIQKESLTANATLINDIKTGIHSIETVLEARTSPSLAEDGFEDAVYSLISEASQSNDGRSATNMLPGDASERLQKILKSTLQLHADSIQETLKSNGIPSRLVRYWLPATVLLLSSSTLLRIFIRRRATIVQWIRDLGRTTIDFWSNWVVDPLKKILGTIRHDSASEVSIMSKSSLESDRASLERMVVDFAIDNPVGSKLTEVEIAEVRTKVQEGDLTPVLRVYEEDMQSPIWQSIRGDLIRALLIQVQKTKVDVEIAMRGINNLLKSQELVFGFVGVTPGLLLSYMVFRWLGNLPGRRQSIISGKKQIQAHQVLRNIDKILTSSPQSDTGTLSFQDFGLLVCEALVLRDSAKRSFPKARFKEFVEDLDNDLLDNSSGVGRQIRVLDRIRWAYAQWL